MAGDNKVRAIDIGEGWWQDVDTPQMLKHAERQMAERMQSAPLKLAHQCVHPTACDYDRRSRVTISPRPLLALITANALRTRLTPATVIQR